MALIGLFTEGALAAGHELSDCYRELGAQIVLADQLGYDFFSTTQSYGFDHPGSSFSAVANPFALFAAHAPLTSAREYPDRHRLSPRFIAPP
jgi:alkanesulfonate monooxygenase SsuD/methylene tetrahydromethanopterin reductase-like flavin-dependent oxidoreductase (luciferase family)